MNIYFKSLKLHLKSLLEYKASFIISFLSQILVFFSYYFVIVSLFSKFSNVKGFTLYEVLLCFSIIQIGFAFNEIFSRGIDTFENLIINGNFDRILLRPKNILLQAMASDADYVKASRLIQAFIILIIALINLKIKLTLFHIILLLLMIISSIITFFCIFLVSASFCFITIQGLEARNVLTAGGKEIAQYPIGIFKKNIAFIFTFIIPYGLVNYYPLLYFLGRVNKLSYAFSELLVIFYLIPSIYIFYKGIKRYSSTGS